METQSVSSALNTNAQLSTATTHDDQRGVSSANAVPVQDDQVTLSPSNPTDARKLLNQQILAALNSVLEVDGQAKIETLEPSDYSPEKVAERILSFIQIGVARLAAGNESDERKAELLSKAIAGVEQGFAEAREILSGLGVLEGKVAEDIDTTYELISQGLEELKQNFGLVESSENEDSPASLVG